MITLGYIKEVNAPGSTVFKIRLPVFEQAGIADEQLFDAVLCYNPGNLNAYREGDCVVVGFLDNRLAKAIILGKLYTGDEESASNFSFANSLKVTESAVLPGNTIIGNITAQDINGLSESVKNLQIQIDMLNK